MKAASFSHPGDQSFRDGCDSSIRKVQTMSDLPLGPPSIALFPAGFCLDIACRDPDEMSERSQFWGLEEVQFARGRFEGKLLATHSDGVQLSCVQRNLGSQVRGSIPAEAIVLGSILRQDAPILYRGSVVSDRQLMKIDRRREVDCQFHGGSGMIIVAVHAQLFQQVAQATLGAAFFDEGPSDRLVLRGAPCRSGLNRRLLDLLDRGLAAPKLLAAPEYGRIWEHQVLDAILADVIAPDLGMTPTMRHQAARRAEAFLRQHCKRRVSIAELCLETGVPKRTLMLGFRDVFGMPPLTYHRRMRLAAARRDLVNSWPDETSVTKIALRWGFEHFGRFSVDYRCMFGESPITTLRGTRST
jgi:AraC family transcriptional regulator, ethanolamine operon transcriptional activator